MDIAVLAEKIKKGYVPMIVEGFNRKKKQIKFLKRPSVPNPSIYVIHEFKVASFLGNYGAGKTLKTFSLLPGEKTTISIKSFFESKETKKKSENVMDSFSENSAESFEDTLQQESSKTMSEQDSSESADHQEKARDVNTSLSATGVLYAVKIDASVSANFHNASVHDTVKSTSSAMESSVNATHEALEKHTNETNSAREVQINSEAESTQTQSEEKSTVRELVNPNLNRVLNFVFRQLLQEYITITYLNNIKVVFTNGHPESTIIVPINELDSLLASVIEEDKIEVVRNIIIGEYQQVENYRNELVDFLESKTTTRLIPNPAIANDTAGDADENDQTGEQPPELITIDVTYYKKKANLEDAYAPDGVNIKVPGVIMKVARNVLRTDSTIVDALLGQGDALDCFNKIQQDAKAVKLELENNKLLAETEKIQYEKQKSEQIMNLVSGLSEENKVKLLEKMLTCCPDYFLEKSSGVGVIAEDKSI